MSYPSAITMLSTFTKIKDNSTKLGLKVKISSNGYYGYVDFENINDLNYYKLAGKFSENKYIRFRCKEK